MRNEGTGIGNVCEGKMIALVAASWHLELVDLSVRACREELARCGVDVERDLKVFKVPGSLEIPLFCQGLARSGKYTAIVAFGLIVNGGIYRHEFVAQAVIDGIVRVQLDTGVPVLSAVLTPINFHEHETHHAFFAQHLVTKGQEVAGACLALLKAMDDVNNSGGVPLASRYA